MATFVIVLHCKRLVFCVKRFLWKCMSRYVSVFVRLGAIIQLQYRVRHFASEKDPPPPTAADA